jgi:hypothetical protein
MKPEYSNRNSAERQPQILRLRLPLNHPSDPGSASHPSLGAPMTRRTPLRMTGQLFPMMTDQLFSEFQTQDARSC